MRVLLLTAFLGVGFAVIPRRMLVKDAGNGEGWLARALRAFGFWIRYLLFSGVVGVVALRRRGKEEEREEGFRR